MIYNYGLSIALLDSFNLKIKSQINLAFSLVDISVSESCSDYFVAFSNSKLLIFSSLTMNFTLETNFQGSILKVFCGKNHIFVFTDSPLSPIYTFNRISKIKFDSYNNEIEEVYADKSFYLDYTINLLAFDDYSVTNVEMNKNIDKLIVMYKNNKTDETISLLFDISLNCMSTVKFNLIGQIGNLKSKNFIAKEAAFIKEIPDRNYCLVLWENGSISTLSIY